MELLISALSKESGASNSARCTLDEALTLGRGPESPLLLDGTGISREHLRLHAEGEGIYITDLSSNGTWLNARRLTRDSPHPLTPGDEVKIPGFALRIEWRESGPLAVVEQTGGPWAFVRGLAASLSRVEKMLIALALATIGFVVFYLASA